MVVQTRLTSAASPSRSSLKGPCPGCSAYAPRGTDSNEHIYINGDWLKIASSEAIQAVLFEEIGHAIDYKLNGNKDTPGDEGAIFSALIRGSAIPAGESTQNDHHTLIINGQAIAIEAATPTLDSSANPEFTATATNSGAPSGAVGTLVSALIDSGGSLDNFSDADGDLPGIAIIGTNLNGGTLYYSINNGTTWSDVGTVSETSARVLHADGDTRLAFAPATDFTGTISDLITFKAWDQTGAETISVNPTLTATLDTAGSAYVVTLSADGNTAYVADTTSGLQIIDVSNPSSPSLTSTLDTPGYARSVILSADGDTAYLADDESGLQIIDVSNPSSPSLTGTLKTSDKAIEISLSADGNTAFVTDRNSGLSIIDVSNPASPALTSTLDTTGSALGITLAADGNTAFIADYTSGLQIIDVSDTNNPSLTASLDTSGLARSITLSADGNTAFVVDDASGLQIIDVSDTNNPTLTATLDTTGLARSITLSADGNTAFVADDASGLQIVDVSNINSPTLTASLDTTGLAIGVTISADGKTAFIADHASGLQIIDVADPAVNGASGIATKPVPTGNLATHDDAADFTLSADGNTAFVADLDAGLQIIDISNPTSPSLTGTLNTSGTYDVTLSADGGTAFVADGLSGLQIIDVSDTSSPSLSSTLNTSGWAYAVTISADGNTAFVADGSSGLQIIDVSNIASPSLTSSFDISGIFYNVALSADGNTAFVANESRGLRIIDVSNPASPSLTGTYDTAGSAQFVTLSADGNTDYVADGGISLQNVDVSNHASAELIELRLLRYLGLATGISLSADGNTVFVAENTAGPVTEGGGFRIIDVSNPASPTLTASLDTTGYANGVTLSADGTTAYVTDSSRGLQIIDIAIPSIFQQRVIPQALKFQTQHSHRPPTTPPPDLAVTGTNSPPMQAPITISTSPNSPHREGGNTYTLTSDDVELTSATAFSVTLNATDQLQLPACSTKRHFFRRWHHLQHRCCIELESRRQFFQPTAPAMPYRLHVAAPSLTPPPTTIPPVFCPQRQPARLSRFQQRHRCLKLTITGGSGSTYTLTSGDVEPHRRQPPASPSTAPIRATSIPCSTRTVPPLPKAPPTTSPLLMTGHQALTQHRHCRLTGNAITVRPSNPPFAINDGGDGHLNASEGSSVTIAGTTSGAEDGQTVALNISSAGGGTPINTTASVNSNAIPSLALISLLGDGTLTITADVDDLAGNAATQATDTSNKDTTAPTISVAINDDGDGHLNASEDSSVTIAGTTSGAEDGQTVSSTSPPLLAAHPSTPLPALTATPIPSWT